VSDFQPGARIGGFLLTRVLGEGGQATVWAAFDEQLGRDVALKVFRGDVLSDVENAERLRREARALAALKHDNVLPVLQWGEHGNNPFIVVPFIDGGTLEQVMATRGPLKWEEGRPILRDVASAIAAAHLLGIVHRDIKPSNVLLDTTTGRALLSDFGIALTGDETSGPLTETGAVMGTPQYLSPERRFAGTRGAASSDVYAFGLLAKDLIDTTTVPKPAAALLAQCLLPDPQARPDAATLVEALTGPSAHPLAIVGAMSESWQRLPRYSQALILLMGVALIAVTLVLMPRSVRSEMAEMALKVLKMTPKLRHLL
jgi:eukaryotic-like serine/threonine-protein kinase